LDEFIFPPGKIFVLGDKLLEDGSAANRKMTALPSFRRQ
jgi:hypothetical protein